MAESQQESELIVRYDILDGMLKHMSSEDVARLFCTGKHLGEVLVAALRKDTCQAASWMLRAALLGVVESSEGAEHAALQQLRLLVHQVMKPEDDVLLSVMLRFPWMPQTAASVVISAGQRVSYQQLLSVVKDCVPGVEVWMKVYRQLNIPLPPGMHPAAATICREGLLYFQGGEPPQTTDEQLLDQLYFALAMPQQRYHGDQNWRQLCSSPGAQRLNFQVILELLQAAMKAKASARAEVLIKTLPGFVADIKPEQLISLIETAVNLRLTNIAQLLCQLPAARHMSKPVFMSMLQSAVQMRGSEAMEALRQLPVVQELLPSDVGPLLITAARAGGRRKIQALCNLPAAAAVDSAVARHALKAAVRSSDPTAAAAVLAGYPILKFLDATAISRLIAAALAAGTTALQPKLRAILALPNASDISVSGVVQLLQQATEINECSSVAALRMIPAASGLQADKLLQLLTIAMQHGDNGMLVELSRLPAAAKIERPALRDLMVAAVKHPNAGRLAVVSRLPSAHRLSAADVVQLLHQIEITDYDRLESLLALPTARLVDAATALKLLQAAIEQGHAGAAALLIKMLPAAQQLGRDALGELIAVTPATAALSSRSLLIATLLDIAGAHEYSNSMIYRLLEEMVEDGGYEAVTKLCSLPAASTIDSAQLQVLLNRSLKFGASFDTNRSSNMETVEALCKLLAGAELTTDQVDGLLDAACVSKAVYVFAPLLQLPGARDISDDAVARIILTSAEAAAWPIVHELLHLPGAKNMSADAVHCLIITAAGRAAWSIVRQILRMRLAARITSSVILQTWQLATQSAGRHPSLADNNNNNPYHTAIAIPAIGPAPQINFLGRY